LGNDYFDPSCATQAIPHLQVGMAYGRIAAGSAAFKECVTTAMAQRTGAGRSDVTIGPYHACSADPAATTAATVLSLTASTNDVRAYCDYSKIGTSESAHSGTVNTQSEETLTFGSVLGALQTSQDNCNFNPDFKPCVSDPTYIQIAGDTFHEVMHDRGYDHFEFHAPYDYLCGIPAAQSPYYGNSVPYIVSECLRAVLDQSMDKCDFHADCGAGLRLVSSLYAANPQCACVSDPKQGAPTPPNAPTGCIATMHCQSSVTWSCDTNPHPLVVQHRASLDVNSPWTDGAPVDIVNNTAYDYRVCAVSIYGKACTGPVAFGPAAYDTGCSPGGGGTPGKLPSCSKLCPVCEREGGICIHQANGCLCA
jgi:hypothetical protein